VNRWVVLAATVALVGAPAAVGSTGSCPGPGCVPIGSFSVPLPATGKASFFIVTISGHAATTPTIGVNINGSVLTGNREVAGFAPKPVVKSGTATVKFYLAVANPKSKLSKTVRLPARCAPTCGRTPPLFQVFGGSGQLTNPVKPDVQQVPVKVFADHYHGLFKLGFAWLQDWESHSPPPGTKPSDVITAILVFGGGK
jgi:hypothetical protein